MSVVVLAKIQADFRGLNLMFAATLKTVFIATLIIGIFPLKATAITAEEAMTLIRKIDNYHHKAEKIIQIIQSPPEIEENSGSTDRPTTSDAPPSSMPTGQERYDTNTN